MLWCVAIDRAVREGRLDGIWEGLGLVPPARRGYWDDAFQTAETVPLDKLGNNGFVVSALQAAWRAIVSTADAGGSVHLEMDLRATVGIGGDTDTAAASAGVPLGALGPAPSRSPGAGGWPAGLPMSETGTSWPWASSQPVGASPTRPVGRPPMTSRPATRGRSTPLEYP